MKENTYVYFIQEERLSHKGKARAPIKIGYAKNPETRLKQMQTGNAAKLNLLGTLGPVTLKRARTIETLLHRHFYKQRIDGEWFSGKIIKTLHTIISGDMEAFMDSVRIPGKSKKRRALRAKYAEYT